jgi:hypothetical protein
MPITEDAFDDQISFHVNTKRATETAEDVIRPPGSAAQLEADLLCVEQVPAAVLQGSVDQYM